MIKKWIPPIVVIGFGCAIIIICSALFSAIGGVWFGILLTIGILMLLSGIFELHRIKTTAKIDAPLEKRERYEEDEERRPMPEYRAKDRIQSRCERRFYALLKDILNPREFEILPETALVSVVEKLTQTSFRNELFRIIDFCIADAKTSEPLLLIELNDRSHERDDRRERDRKVAEICDRAKIPLVTFLHDDMEDEGFVRKVLRKYLA